MPSRAFWISTLTLLFAVSAQAYRMSVWLPPWDSRAVSSMQINAGRMHEGNPVWYAIAADGGFTRTPNAEAADLRAALTGVDLIPTINNSVGGKFDGDLVAAVLGSAEGRQRHADALTQLVIQNAYDGIDIDYESMSAGTRDSFTAFVQVLSSKLHASGKRLSVTVSAKTSPSEQWRGPAGEDWPALGAAADTVKIMAYDYHWSGSAAGPIAPLDWLDKIVTYAESVIPASRIIIGLPWYGYDWQGNHASGLTYSKAMDLARSAGAVIGRDSNGESTFTYGGHEVYFQDAVSYETKTRAILKKHPGIGGFAHWRGGGEDPSLWPEVARLREASGEGSFSVSGPPAVSVKRGQAVQVGFALTPIDGFSGTAAVSVLQLDTFPGTVETAPNVTVGTPAVLTLTASPAAVSGPFRLKVRMTSGRVVRDSVVTVTIEPGQTKRRSVGP